MPFVRRSKASDSDAGARRHRITHCDRRCPAMSTLHQQMLNRGFGSDAVAAARPPGSIGNAAPSSLAPARSGHYLRDCAHHVAAISTQINGSQGKCGGSDGGVGIRWLLQNILRRHLADLLRRIIKATFAPGVCARFREYRDLPAALAPAVGDTSTSISGIDRTAGHQ